MSDNLVSIMRQTAYALCPRGVCVTRMAAWKAADEIERWRSLGEAILGNDPDDAAADAVTALDVWRKEAETLLGLSHDRSNETR